MGAKDFVILLYHGVTNTSHRGIENYSQKHVCAADFERQIAFLNDEYNVLSLLELLRRSQNDTLPARAVAVTFDDGFENNWTTAFPILERYSVPATFFLATGFIGKQRRFWVDKVEYLVNESPAASIQLPTLGNTWSIRTNREKEVAVREIKTALKSGIADPNAVVVELESASATEPLYDYADYRTLTWDQVRRMHASGLCTIGAHTVNHAIMSHLTRAGKAHEVAESKRKLEQELGEPITLFSYPEGLAEHFDDETVETLQSLGFEASPTAIFGNNRAGTCPFHLRRNMVGFTAPFEQALEAQC